MAFAPCDELPLPEQQPTVSGRLEIRIQPTSSSPIQSSNFMIYFTYCTIQISKYQCLFI